MKKDLTRNIEMMDNFMVRLQSKSDRGSYNIIKQKQNVI